jgi:hypothetical protein
MNNGRQTNYWDAIEFVVGALFGALLQRFTDRLNAVWIAAIVICLISFVIWYYAQREDRPPTWPKRFVFISVLVNKIADIRRKFKILRVEGYFLYFRHISTHPEAEIARFFAGECVPSP